MAKPSSRMRDGLQSRGDGRWTATLYLGRSEPDANGKRRIIQKTISLGKCSRQEARAKREELLVAMPKDELVVPSRRTVGEWLKTWLDESIRPAKRTNTVIVYENVITNHLVGFSSRRSAPDTSPNTTGRRGPPDCPGPPCKFTTQ